MRGLWSYIRNLIGDIVVAAAMRCGAMLSPARCLRLHCRDRFLVPSLLCRHSWLPSPVCHHLSCHLCVVAVVPPPMCRHPLVATNLCHRCRGLKLFLLLPGDSREVVAWNIGCASCMAMPPSVGTIFPSSRRRRPCSASSRLCQVRWRSLST